MNPYRLLQLTPITRKVCFQLSLSQCCKTGRISPERVSVDIVSEGCPLKPLSRCDVNLNDNAIISYPIFEEKNDGSICIILDSAMMKLTPGRYLMRVMLDKCYLIQELKMQWGQAPVIMEVATEESSAGDCFDEMGCTEKPIDTVPIFTCDCEKKDCSVNICKDKCGNECDEPDNMICGC